MIPALLYFEWALTFTREVDRVWRGRFTGATVIYMLTRYSILLVSAVDFIVGLLHTADNNVRFTKAYVNVVLIDLY